LNGIGFPIYHRPGHDTVQLAGVTPHRFPEHRRKLVGPVRVRLGSGGNFRRRRDGHLRNPAAATRPKSPATTSILRRQATVHANAIYRLSNETPVIRRRTTYKIIICTILLYIIFAFKRLSIILMIGICFYCFVLSLEIIVSTNLFVC